MSFSIILLFLIIGILVGTVKLFLSLGPLFSSGLVTGSYKDIISDVLLLFILIELSKPLLYFFEHQRLRLTFIIDAGIVFVLREIMILLYEHKLPPDNVYAFSALLLVLGVLRFSSLVVHHKKFHDINIA